MRREAKIVAETESRIELAGRDCSVDDWCDGCAAYATRLSLEMAAAMACVGAGAIRYWMEGDHFHYQQTRAGLFRICQESFLDHLKKLNFLPKPMPQETIREVFGSGREATIKLEDG